MLFPVHKISSVFTYPNKMQNCIRYTCSDLESNGFWNIGLACCQPSRRLCAIERCGRFAFCLAAFSASADCSLFSMVNMTSLAFVSRVGTSSIRCWICGENLCNRFGDFFFYIYLPDMKFLVSLYWKRKFSEKLSVPPCCVPETLKTWDFRVKL